MPSTERKRILFVDDEPAMLTGLKNLLWKDRARWDMVFALGGHQALEEAHKAPFDVVVSDMRMPEMDGATLLTRIKDESPATGRIILTGYTDDDALRRALRVLHQLLTKPCSVIELRAAIERNLAAGSEQH